MTSWPIIRLQVQRSPLKPGAAPHRWYDPSPIVEVDALDVDPAGCTGVTADDGRILDVHHTRHPLSRDPRGKAGLTVMGTGDYRALRDTYGPHLPDGIAGESLLVEAPAGLADKDFPDEMTLETRTGPVTLRGFRVASPCVEFTRFCLRRDAGDRVDRQLKDTLLALGGGARGYRAIATTATTIRAGDRLRAR
ncbi:MAG: hypothetical protein ACR2P2_11525 [Nakamurella sp.]